MGGGASAAPAPVEREGDEVAVHVERLSDVRCAASELYVELYVEHRPRDGDGGGAPRAGRAARRAPGRHASAAPPRSRRSPRSGARARTRCSRRARRRRAAPGLRVDEYVALGRRARASVARRLRAPPRPQSARASAAFACAGRRVRGHRRPAAAAAGSSRSPRSAGAADAAADAGDGGTAADRVGGRAARAAPPRAARRPSRSSRCGVRARRHAGAFVVDS